MKLLKIKAFSLFHRCELRCVKNIYSDQSENCFKSCEKGNLFVILLKKQTIMMIYIWIIDLDEYFLLKKNSRIQRTVYYALPRYEVDSKKQYVIPENESFE
jgi:hypothetical protein